MLTIRNNDYRTDERIFISGIGYTLFKIIQSLTQPINLSTGILHAALSKFDAISALQNLLLLFQARQFEKNSFIPKCFST